MTRDPHCRGVCKAEATSEIPNEKNLTDCWSLDYSGHPWCTQTDKCTRVKSSSCGPGMKGTVTEAIGCTPTADGLHVQFDPSKAKCACLPNGDPSYEGKAGHGDACTDGDDCLGGRCMGTPKKCVQYHDTEAHMGDVTECSTAYTENGYCKAWKNEDLRGNYCGIRDHACCNNKVCFQDTACDPADNTCKSCGGLDELCCPGENECSENYKCTGGKCSVPCDCTCHCHRKFLDCEPNSSPNMTCPSGYTARQLASDIKCGDKKNRGDYCSLYLGSGDCKHGDNAHYNKSSCECECIEE